jgi:Zn-dependent M28 family amino/carboxypeptidase
MLLGLSERGTNLSEFYQSVSSNPSAFRPFQLNYTFSSQARLETIQVPTQNIIAVVEGSDPDLKDEYVVVTAHYDHTGIGAPDATGDRIYNGADDDGSGTVAVMTMAKAMNDAKLAGNGPRRSVMFLHVSAEEIGLLGSRYYSDHPTVPVENIIANLNVDMIGRIDEEHEAAGEEDYVYIIGAEIISSGLNTTLNKANELNGNEIRFDMKYNDLTDPNQFYRRSDHWNFGRLGIPFVFYFTGVHVDYHRPSDTPDKILYNKYAKITRQIYSTAAELANNPERPVVDSQEFINITQTNSR